MTIHGLKIQVILDKGRRMRLDFEIDGRNKDTTKFVLPALPFFWMFGIQCTQITQEGMHK
jgi:hypothetical protein